MDLHDLTHAQDAVAALLGSVGPDGWAGATPCGDWDVSGVARHLIIGERAFTTSLGGEQYDLAAIRGDVLELADGDLPATYAAGAAALRDAFDRADPAATFPTGIGPMTAPAVAELRTIEALVHGWDIASGAGSRLDVDEAVADRAIAHSRALLERLPPERQVFGPPQAVADDAPALDRLVALLGRQVSG